MQFNYKEEQTAANIVQGELMDLLQQFSVVAGRYKSALTEFYLANTQENKNLVNEAKQMLTEIYAKTFTLSARLNTAILENNNNIQSLDEYLDQLKTQVDSENKMLDNVGNTARAAQPRKQYISKTTENDYYMDAFYLCAILGGAYYFKKLIYDS